MDDARIRLLVAQIGVKDNTGEEQAWVQLRPLGVDVVPYIAEHFPQAKKLQTRRALLFHVIRYARVNEQAFQLGLLGLNDRSSIVRYRACCIVAYSLRHDAVPHLEKLLVHDDSKTVNDAKAAILAIQHQNHHYFMDRSHSGKSFWEVNKGDLPPGSISLY